LANRILYIDVVARDHQVSQALWGVEQVADKMLGFQADERLLDVIQLRKTSSPRTHRVQHELNSLENRLCDSGIDADANAPANLTCDRGQQLMIAVAGDHD